MLHTPDESSCTEILSLNHNLLNPRSHIRNLFSENVTASQESRIKVGCQVEKRACDDEDLYSYTLHPYRLSKSNTELPSVYSIACNGPLCGAEHA